MKQSNFSSQLLCSFFFALLCMVFIPGQSNAQHRGDKLTPVFTDEIADVKILDVAISTIRDSKGLVTLLAINPRARDQNFYFQKVYNVQWFNNGKLVGSGPVLNTSKCGKITVMVTDRSTGSAGANSLTFGVCKSYYSLSD